MVNLVPPTAGGGLQNAVSLVMSIASHESLRRQCIVICPAGGPVHQACKVHGLAVTPVRAGFIGRTLFELGGGVRIARRHGAKTVFTLFGNAPLVSPGLYRISGFALSNILHPEVDFWQDLPPLNRSLKKLKDAIRLWLARRSDEIIVETNFLGHRARNGPFKDRIVHVVKMEPSAAVVQALAGTRRRNRNDRLRLLALTGPHPNKRLIAMAPIMAKLASIHDDRGVTRPEFLVSIDEKHPHAKAILKAFDAVGAPLPQFLGKISPNEVATQLQEVDAIVNIARLESFSNNWVEAWAAGLPLISTDADWARASCGNAAIYIDPDLPELAATKIDIALSSPETLAALVLAGKDQLSKLGAEGRKIDRYAQLILTTPERS